MAGDKLRLDRALVRRGLASTRSRARDAIVQGAVTVDGETVTRPGRMVGETAQIELSADACPYVSRGGVKLAHGLDHFGIDPAGLEALDLGASTGGFTDVLLRRGTAHVTAIDVGHGQLHESLRGDARVTLHERLNARDLEGRHLAGSPRLIVCDVSFISLTQALAPALDLAAPDAWLVALVKPQFEVGRGNVGKGGVVASKALHDAACERVADWLAQRPHWTVIGVVPSPLHGADGNREFVLGARRSPTLRLPDSCA